MKRSEERHFDLIEVAALLFILLGLVLTIQTLQERPVGLGKGEFGVMQWGGGRKP